MSEARQDMEARMAREYAEYVAQVEADWLAGQKVFAIPFEQWHFSRYFKDKVVRQMEDKAKKDERIKAEKDEKEAKEKDKPNGG